MGNSRNSGGIVPRSQLRKDTMRIFIADKFEAWGVDQLKGLGDLFNEPGLKPDDLKKRLTEANPEVLIVRSTKIPDAMMAAASKLQLIVRAGAGVDNIDMPA